MINKLLRWANTYDESPTILEHTKIAGLYWKKNTFYQTSDSSRIVLPDAGQGIFTIVYHGADFSTSVHGGYEVYGCHLGQDDVLTFLAHDDRVMKGHFVDCRKGSPTLHQTCSLVFRSDPDRSLVIGRGIAHIFDNLVGMTTLNQMTMHYDIRNADFVRGTDVVNIPRDTLRHNFPELTVNRFRSPSWLCKLMVKKQRIDIASTGSRYPFQFKHQGRNYRFVPKSREAA